MDDSSTRDCLLNRPSTEFVTKKPDSVCWCPRQLRSSLRQSRVCLETPGGDRPSRRLVILPYWHPNDENDLGTNRKNFFVEGILLAVKPITDLLIVILIGVFVRWNESTFHTERTNWKAHEVWVHDILQERDANENKRTEANERNT